MTLVCSRSLRVSLLAAVMAAVPALAQTPGATGGKAPVYTEQRDDPFYTTDRMDWPGPNQYRDASGSPGPAYWQQRADYTIAATLDTAGRTITGMVTVHYTNNSPDTLRWVWMQLDQNLFRQGSKGSAVFAADSRWGARNFSGGYRLGDVTADGAAVAPKADDTMMRLDLAQPLAPHGGKLTIVVHYAFQVPDHGADRMGRDSALYEIAQWYPRMAVYDDVRGWNTDPYIGQGEFYLEYGDIDYAVTVPAGYTVAGSGVLQNPAEVLSPSERQRLAAAARDSAVVPIITAAEAEAAKRTHSPGMRTWRFRAANVRDVAWGAAPDFRWDATSTGAIPGVLSGAEGGAGVGAGCGADPVDHPALLAARVAVPVSAGDVGGGPGGRDGVSDVRDGALRHRGPGVDLRDGQPRAWARVVPDGRGVERAAVRVDG